MTVLQCTTMIALAVLATQCTRWIPFLLFKNRTPALVRYLGLVLPSAIWGMLVVYCFRNGILVEGSDGIPELIAAAITILLQSWKKNMSISIAAGTLAYMVLIQNFY